MEPLEQTLIPWAQGVASSNLAAPTNILKNIRQRLAGSVTFCDVDCDVTGWAEDSPLRKIRRRADDAEYSQNQERDSQGASP